MKTIDSLRGEFYSLLRDTGLVDSNINIYNVSSYDENLLRAVICYGLYPGICSIVVSFNSYSVGGIFRVLYGTRDSRNVSKLKERA